ncbi:MAG: hypothetical protein HFJ12_01570 [Bacilli bacterium]|nr:hypothetical protein [Bacilli bacterium]
MINYADYEFYQKEYKGNLSKSLFDSLIVKASRTVDRNVNKKLTQKVIDSLSGREQYQLKYTTCELCDYIKLTGGNTAVGKASSISIDGVSINKGQKSESQMIRGESQILNDLPLSLTRYL